MKVVKNSGHIVEFNQDKLRHSLLRSGAQPHKVEFILKEINKNLYDGISTKQIYKMAFSLLKKEANVHAAKYNLRRAIEMLGPAGFFFEKFIARLYASEGFAATTNITLQGKCVTHEIDVVIKKDDKVGIIECKFHGSREVRSDVKVPMYILSRFNDVKYNTHTIFKTEEAIDNCTIATNTRFTGDAVAFASCSGLSLLSWNYPEANNIKTKIDNNCLYPITCLTSLTAAEKEKLLILDILLVKELVNNTESLDKIGLSANRMRNVIKEASGICNYM